MTTTPRDATHATIGGYRLLAQIGEGGMGIVHLAQKVDQGPDGARVALKVLRPHVIGDSEARRRLEQEVASLDRVTSPRIAEIIDADVHGPTPYVVTRYVPGLSLNRQVGEEGLIEGPHLLHFAACLAEALAAVHAVGVLHRDVKPSNVLMEGRSPVLIDFGLARAAEDPKLTVTGFMLGTPGYLPPEVLYGDPATPASDVYAWAATVAFAATGRPPFGTGHTMAILDRVRRGEHDIDGVPEPLADVLHACLQGEPARRPTLPQLRARLRELAAPDFGITDSWTRPVAGFFPQGPPVPDTAVLSSVREPATMPAFSEPVSTPLGEPMPEQPPRIVSLPTARGEKVLRGLQPLALGVVAAAAVAFAPYVAFAGVSALVLLLRTASVTRQRHQRRRMLRGRARWFDVPTTTLSLPGYLLLAALGAVMLLGFAGVLATGAAAAATLADKTATVAVLLAGLVTAPALWWGPGSSRVREMLDPLFARTARIRGRAWVVVGVCVVVAGVLAGAVLIQGPHWYPSTQAPWR